MSRINQEGSRADRSRNCRHPGPVGIVVIQGRDAERTCRCRYTEPILLTRRTYYPKSGSNIRRMDGALLLAGGQFAVKSALIKPIPWQNRSSFAVRRKTYGDY